MANISLRTCARYGCLFVWIGPKSTLHQLVGGLFHLGFCPSQVGVTQETAQLLGESQDKTRVKLCGSAPLGDRSRAVGLGGKRLQSPLQRVFLREMVLRGAEANFQTILGLQCCKASTKPVCLLRLRWMSPSWCRVTSSGALFWVDVMDKSALTA